MEEEKEQVEEAPKSVKVEDRIVQIKNFRENLLALLVVMATYNKDILEFKIGATSAARLSKTFGFEDAILASKKKEGGKTYYSAILIVNEELATCEDERLDVSPRSPADFRLLSKYFQYYRSLRRHSDQYLHFCNVDEIIVYWQRREGGDEKPMTIIFPEDILIASEERDPLFGNSIMNLRREFEGRREIVLNLKDDLFQLPKRLGRVLAGRYEPLLANEFQGGDVSHLYRSYQEAFVEEVLDPESSYLRPGFVEGRQLSPGAQHFRDAMEFAFLRSDNMRTRRDTDTLQTHLGMAKLRLRVKSPVIKRKECHNGFLKKLAFRLAVSIARSERKSEAVVEMKDVFFRKHLAKLLGFVLVDVGDCFVFRREFLKDGWLPKDLRSIRVHLEEEVRQRGIAMDSLGKYSFKISGSKPDTQYSAELVEVLVQDFLSKIKFATTLTTVEELKNLSVERLGKFDEDLNPVEFIDATLLVDVGNLLRDAEWGSFLCGQGLKSHILNLKAERASTERSQ